MKGTPFVIFVLSRRLNDVSDTRWRYDLIYAEWRDAVSWCHIGRWEEFGEALGNSERNLNMAGHGPSHHVSSFAMATSEGAMGTNAKENEACTYAGMHGSLQTLPCRHRTERLLIHAWFCKRSQDPRAEQG